MHATQGDLFFERDVDALPPDLAGKLSESAWLTVPLCTCEFFFPFSFSRSRSVNVRFCMCLSHLISSLALWLLPNSESEFETASRRTCQIIVNEASCLWQSEFEGSEELPVVLCFFSVYVSGSFISC